jgi:hypothetical protein
VGSQRLTASAMARPNGAVTQHKTFYILIFIKYFGENIFVMPNVLNTTSGVVRQLTSYCSFQASSDVELIME